MINYLYCRLVVVFLLSIQYAHGTENYAHKNSVELDFTSAGVKIVLLKTNLLAEVRLSGNQFTSLHHLSPLERGLMSLTVVPTTVSHLNADIEAKYQLALEIGLAVSEREVSNYDPLLFEVKKISDALSLWKEGDTQSRMNALRLVSGARGNIDRALREELSIDQLYVAMLFATDQYQLLGDVGAEIVQLSRIGPCALDCKYTRWAALKYWGRALQNSREFSRSSDIYEQALKELDAEEHLELIWRLNREEIRQHFSQVRFLTGHHENDVAIIESARLLAEEVRVNADKLGEIRIKAGAENVLAFYYWNINNFQRGEELMRESVNNYERAGISAETSAAHNNLSVLLDIQGKYDESIISLRRSIEIQNQFPDNIQKAYLLVNLAKSYLQIGSFEFALNAAKQGLSLFEDAQTQAGIASANEIIGDISFEVGDYAASIKAYKKSISIYTGDTATANLLFATTLRISLAQAYAKLDDKENSYAYISESKALLDHLLNGSGANYRDDPKLAKILYGISEVATAFNDNVIYAKNRQYFRDLVSRQKNDNAYNFLLFKFRTLDLIWSMRTDDDRVVRTNFEKGIKAFNRYKAKINTDALGFVIARRREEIIQPYITFLRHKKDDQLGAEMIYKVLEAYQSTYNSHVSISPIEPNDSSTTDMTLGRVQQKVINEENPKARTKALASVAELYQSLLIQTPTSRSGALIGIEGVPELEKIQAYLDLDTTLLRYYIREHDAFLLVINKSSTKLINLSLGESFESELVEFKKNLLSRSPNFSQLAYLQASKLGLNQPFLNGVKKLVVVSDGVLESTPLGALNVADFGDQYIPLARQISLVVTDSFSAYFSQNARVARPHTADLAIFADPLFDDKELYEPVSSRSLSGKRAWYRKLERLPWTAKEAEHIQELFPQKKTVVALREMATASVLLSDSMTNAKVLHIASHGYFSEVTPNIVGLATAKPLNDEEGGSFVTITDLMSETFLANLVVVSGCETSLGVRVVGSGVNGLSRSMLTRGAGAVIGTLWPIPDRPTSEFMREFYTALKRHNGNAEKALFDAKRAFQKSGRYRHPYFWASFNLVSINKDIHENVFSNEVF